MQVCQQEGSSGSGTGAQRCRAKEGGVDLVRRWEEGPGGRGGVSKMNSNYFPVISSFFFSKKRKKNTYGAIPSHVGLASLLDLSAPSGRQGSLRRLYHCDMADVFFFSFLKSDMYG